MICCPNVANPPCARRDWSCCERAPEKAFWKSVSALDTASWRSQKPSGRKAPCPASICPTKCFSGQKQASPSSTSSDVPGCAALTRRNFLTRLGCLNSAFIFAKRGGSELSAAPVIQLFLSLRHGVPSRPHPFALRHPRPIFFRPRSFPEET